MRVAIFGGSFDPVHNGHLNSATELVDKLGLQQLRFMPCGQHAFSKALYFDNEQRIAMLKLATGLKPSLAIDSRELDREGVSYSIDSCREVRTELGERAQIFLVIGSDLLPGLHRWHHWEALLDYVNIVVMQRAGHEVDGTGHKALAPAVSKLWQKARSQVSSDTENTTVASHGEFITLELAPWPLSSTQVRETLTELAQTPAAQCAALSDRLRAMLHPQVYNYIIENRLLKA